MTEETRLANIKKLENFCDSLPQFYIEGIVPTYNTVEDFINAFTMPHTSQYDIPPTCLYYRTNNYVGSNAIMYRGKWRSVVDTIIAAKQHTTFTAVDIINAFQKSYTEGTLLGHYCGTIHRIILRLYRGPECSGWTLGMGPKAPNKMFARELPDLVFEDIFYTEFTSPNMVTGKAEVRNPEVQAPTPIPPSFSVGGYRVTLLEYAH
jgi:hypothetical protein